MALSHACLKVNFILIQDYEKAKELLEEFENSSEKGKNWELFILLLDELALEVANEEKKQVVDAFEQHHRISKNWPKVQIPGTQIFLSMAFSYPFVEPPELLPEFDYTLMTEFHILKVENKPEAPWINRFEKGLIFTPNIQVFENLQLSITTTKNQQNSEEQEKNKPISEMDHSVDLSSENFQMQTEALKQKFKLDS